MGFWEFVRDLDTERRKLTVLNRTEPDPIYEMLVDLFARGQQRRRLEVQTRCGKPVDTVVLEDDEYPIAVSPLSSIRDTLLLTNSDIYVTGTRSIADVDTPDVLARMGDTKMFARDYPHPRKQKLLLIEISRYIEKRAWSAGEGRLFSGFQRLSRIDDESGTGDVYDRLGDTDLEVHAYGLPDWDPPREMGIRSHGIVDPEIRDSWFVIYDPPRDESRKVALVAVKPDPDGDRWEAFWTHDGDRVDRIREYLLETHGPDGHECDDPDRDRRPVPSEIARPGAGVDVVPTVSTVARKRPATTARSGGGLERLAELGGLLGDVLRCRLQGV